MPTLRKVIPEIGDTWALAHSKLRGEDQHYAWGAQPAVLFITVRQRWRDGLKIGDVLRLCGPEDAPATEVVGVVLEVRAGADAWDEALLAMACGGERWVRPGEVTEQLGRVKGVSRIDQEKKVIGGHVHGATHGWFVRLYEGSKPRMTCSFSDASAGGRRAALRAALAYHAANVGPETGEGIAFV